MSFRVEEKIVCSRVEFFKIFSDLTLSGMKFLYPKRLISSVYLDNTSLDMFSDSEDGILPRKKIRIREYPQKLNERSLEIKISSIEGRFKETFVIDNELYNKYLKEGYFDISYGVCKPLVKVEFSREYFQLAGVRITFDSEIKYESFGSFKTFHENRNVVELKASKDVSSDFLNSLISEPRRRFSKYWNAVNYCI